MHLANLSLVGAACHQVSALFNHGLGSHAAQPGLVFFS